MNSLKEQYWKYSLIAIILVLGLILFLKLTPFMGGLLGACTIYIMLRKQMFYLTHKRHFGKGISAVLLLLETILCFLVPLSLVAWLLIHKLQTVNVDTQAFIHTITQLTDWVRTQTSYDLFDQKNISSVASILPSIGQFLMGGISSFTVNIGVLIIVLYFMLIGGKRMEQYIYEILPFNEENKKEVLTEIHLLVRSNAIGIPLLAVIQGMIASLGYYLFDAPSVLLFGFLTCFATIIPIVGTALVWIRWLPTWLSQATGLMPWDWCSIAD